MSTNNEELIASALNSFDARLKQLEKPEDKTRLEKIQKNASFVALVVGIFLSFISLFDVFWSKPNEELFRNMEEFNKSVNAVANLRQSMIQVQYQSNNPQMFIAMNSMVTPQVLANIQYATSLLPKIGEHAGIPQLIVLISEAMNIYDWKSAKVLVDRAVNMKDSVPSLQSEAWRYRARLMYYTGNLQEGRISYRKALNILSNESAFGINAMRANIAADWIVAEFSFGDCSIANEQIRMFVELIKQPQIFPPVRVGSISALKYQLAQLQRCRIPVELSELD